MMYPRLKLAQNLLADDGVIFISIDDNEVHNLRKMCDEVFGESNFVACNIWQKRTSPDARKKLSAGHEYVVVYAKNSANLEVALNKISLSGNDRENFKNPDNDIRGPWVSSDFTAQGFRPNQVYTIKTPGGAEYTPAPGRCWKNIESVYLKQLAEGRMWFGIDGKGVPRRKTYLSEKEGKTVWTWWPNSEVGHTQEAAQEQKEIFKSETSLFDYPKPVRLLKRIIEISLKSDSTVLDFFSGSATTAHAVMQLNAEDGGNRKFIMVQLPEPCDEKSEAYKAGYKNICEIGKERIRRAGEKIQTKLEEENAQLKLGEEPKQVPDIGFRVLKLDETNMKDVYYSAEEYSQTMLENMESNIKEDRTDLDLLYGVLLDWGLKLTDNHKIVELNGIRVHCYNFDVGSCQENGLPKDCALMACFADKVGEDVIRAIAKSKPQRAVFRDCSFTDSPEKINVTEIFKLFAPDTSVKVI